MANEDGESKQHGFADKLKHPFHELKEKFEGTHLHDAKVHLINRK